MRQVAKELDVRYVLEGSVRKAGRRIRVTGSARRRDERPHVWAERYDRDLVDIFAVQDEITRAIIGAIAPGIVMAEIQHSQSKTAGARCDTWDRIMRAHWHIRRFTRDDFSEARRLIEELLRHEPNNAGYALGEPGVLALALRGPSSAGWTRRPPR